MKLADLTSSPVKTASAYRRDGSATWRTIAETVRTRRIARLSLAPQIRSSSAPRSFASRRSGGVTASMTALMVKMNRYGGGGVEEESVLSGRFAGLSQSRGHELVLLVRRVRVRRPSDLHTQRVAVRRYARLSRRVGRIAGELPEYHLQG
jgi:hypothetical protein